ncbi:MAG: restriction endonuclease subunit S [Anaerolineae bacterium]|nr:restriction endonuclease subunit S [Anaerolineae bacterium]
MTLDLKPYPAYKPSGAQWLGDVPAGWQVLPNRALFVEVKERGFPDEEMLSVTIARGVIRQSTLLADSSNKDSSNEDKSKYKLVCPGDIAYNKMRAWQGSVGVSQYRGIVSPAYVVVRPRAEQESRYYHHLLRIPCFAEEAQRWSYGISSDQWSLRPEHFKQIYCCAPPLPEQAAIVRYLDYHDRLIRRYIRAKQKLIALLEEQKQAIIHRTVTRGLDPNVRLKPSGVEWLGDVPEHWEVLRLKQLVRNVHEQTNTKLRDDAYIALEHVESWSGRLALPAGDVSFDSQVKRFRPNDVLFGKLRPYLAKVARPQMKGVCVGEFLVLRVTNPSILPEFLEHKIRSKQLIDLIDSSTFGAKMPRADWNFIGNVMIAYPPTHEEQRVILRQSGEQTKILQTAIERFQRRIQLVAEYRTSLIADVVTGKTDVRSVPLPDLDADDEPDAEEANV